MVKNYNNFAENNGHHQKNLVIQVQADIQDLCTPVLDDSKMMLVLNKVHNFFVTDLLS